MLFNTLSFGSSSFLQRWKFFLLQMAEIEIKTAPADFRFPTTNQTRHCFTRYIEYHKCLSAKGDDSADCQKFAQYYRSLCPGEWVERWNEQRENGNFPGPRFNSSAPRLVIALFSKLNPWFILYLELC